MYELLQSQRARIKFESQFCSELPSYRSCPGAPWCEKYYKLKNLNSIKVKFNPKIERLKIYKMCVQEIKLEFLKSQNIEFSDLLEQHPT